MKPVSPEFVRELIDFAPVKDSQSSRFAADQLAGAVALFNMLARNRVAYLADEVGMGKTYVALGVMGLIRHLHPSARIVVIAPRENIQRKWIKELRNFVRHNWKISGSRVKSLQDAPGWEPVHCDSLLEFAHEALLHADRDFFLRMTSFSLAFKEADRRADLRRRLRALVPWADTEALSARSFEGFRDAFGAALNAAVPQADLVVVDEAHNLKHGFGDRVSIRNRLMGLAFGHPDGRSFAGDWYGPRAKRLLLLSATPFEDDYAAIQRQLEVFGFGDCALRDASGGDPVSVRDLRDPDLRDEAKREIVGRMLVRRASGLEVAGRLHTKNMYRREWRMGGYAIHDQPMQIEDPRQRLVVALMQKKVAEILQDERFNNSFQIGMLSSFESFLESLGRSQLLARRAAQRDQEAEEEEGAAVFDGDQTDRPDERRGIDTEAVAQVAESYRERFGGTLPHPKLDATADALADAFRTGEKALVFVRRVRTVQELAAKLDRHFDRWLRERMESALPELRADIDDLFARYERDRARRPDEQWEAVPLDAEEPEPLEQLEERRFAEEEDEGSAETFFAWFFRGEGPRGVLSGAAFQKNRLSGESSAYGTLLDDDYVSWLLGHPRDPLAALAEQLGLAGGDALELLRARGYAMFTTLSRSAKGYPRYRVYQAYQAAALALLAERGGDMGGRARTVLDERFAGPVAGEAAAPAGFPGPEVGIGITTIFSELAARPSLREELWPDDGSGDFRARFRRREQRRELLSAMARLGAAYIDLYLLAIADLGSFARGGLGADADASDRATRLARAYADLLEKQSSEPGFHAFRELSLAARAFDLILAVNFPEVPELPLHELASLYAATLQKQVPVGRMSGGVNKRLVRQFRMPGFPLVLATTDVLQEGEDLHTFCRRVVHYGITWTPSAMEQRTGRVDRIGSLVQRELDGAAELPQPDRWIQVFYPHLRDTVEVLQVRRVLQRLNRFLRLIHECRDEPNGDESRIDAAREILEALEAVPPLEGPLESAFPVRAEWLRGDLSATDVEVPDVEATIAHFERMWSTLTERYRIEGPRPSDRFAREGYVAVENGRLAPAHSPLQPAHHFVVTLRSQAAGDATLLRCRSEVGHLRLQDDAILDRVYELQIELGHPRVCVEPDLKSRDELVAIQHDILFSQSSTQLEEVVHLLERTVASAVRLRAELVSEPGVSAGFRRRRRGGHR